MSEATDPPGRALHRIGIRSAQRVSRTQVAGRRCGVLPVLRLRLRAFSCDLRPSAGRQRQSGLETLEGAHVRLDGQLRGSWCAARTKSAPDDGACRCSQTGHAHGTDGQKPRPPAAALGSEITRARTVHAVLLLPSPKCVYVLWTGRCPALPSHAAASTRVRAGASVTGGSDGTSPSGNSSLFTGKLRICFV